MATYQELIQRLDDLTTLYEIVEASTRSDKDFLLTRINLAIQTTQVDLEAAREILAEQDRQAERDRLRLREGEIDQLIEDLGVNTTRSR